MSKIFVLNRAVLLSTSVELSLVERKGLSEVTVESLEIRVIDISFLVTSLDCAEVLLKLAGHAGFSVDIKRKMDATLN